MVGTQISPAQPFAFPHRTEKRMRDATSDRMKVTESLDQAEQFRAIEFEVARRRSAGTLLYLRRRRRPLGPSNRHPQPASFHQRALQETRSGAGRSFAGPHGKGIVEMAHRLMHVHASPLSGIGGWKPGYALEDGIAVPSVIQ